jgi:hypothetical protein
MRHDFPVTMGRTTAAMRRKDTGAAVRITRVEYRSAGHNVAIIRPIADDFVET